MIYFLQAIAIGRIKIGYSARRNLQKRLVKLDTGSPVHLVLLVACNGSRQAEKKLHVRFDESRVKGEWFEPTLDLLRLIFRLRRKYPEFKNKVEGDRVWTRKVHKNRRKDLATEWLIGMFREKLEWTSDEFWASAKQHGISKNAIDEAKVKLNMPKARKRMTVDEKSTWIWWVPADWAPLQQEANRS